MSAMKRELQLRPVEPASDGKTEAGDEEFRSQGDFVKWLRLQVNKPRDSSDSVRRASGGQDL
jgi:hypothetical protein